MNEVPVLFVVEEAFTIRGRGTVVTGRIKRGTVHAGIELLLRDGGRVLKTVRMKSVEMICRSVPADWDGPIAFVIDDVAKEEFRSGMTLVSPQGDR